MEVALLPVCGIGGRQFTQVLAIFAFMPASSAPRPARSFPAFR
jgi:hypothetical protein